MAVEVDKMYVGCRLFTFSPSIRSRFYGKKSPYITLGYSTSNLSHLHSLEYTLNTAHYFSFTQTSSFTILNNLLAFVLNSKTNLEDIEMHKASNCSRQESVNFTISDFIIIKHTFIIILK